MGHIVIVLMSLLLGGCLGSVWTGANLIYDRHDVYKKLDDYQLAANAHHILFDDRILKQPGCSLDLAVLNGDVLLAGHVPSQHLRDVAVRRLNSLSGYRELFDQVDVSRDAGSGLQDSWITTKIRSQIFADASIDPNAFKIITSDRIVYIMGDVRPRQAERVIEIARNTSDVIRVVKLMRYYNLSESPAPNG
ncbi:hemolysin, lipoprotein [Legionella quinlivanii]|uniref:Hemolysin, lipoprotein n=1 Tax=Legionella quinlivanii TaxID=45073 RepID=A0A0W0Y5Z7_9GAMM|nr:BON domain-containing protein [Legionella quinlivanii]KTD51998.1 hemolysin, lipoprotein [Legionella quinlivanii]SEF87070.1 Osmotically-inducible protein OsmY, contains BON domain [Legionella quinlivanii DSM 21216]STY12507.1 hemolysin, lipoprotein [Legionella quinlivanii]